MDITTKTALDALKAAPIKVVLKVTETTSEFIGTKIAEKIVKSKALIDEIQEMLKK